ncbi:hypothetical protein L2E82_45959 [Cichorium intybus]|uniref:Uncharacterized protein n=1 Tax=Cichorium intybus TaxID=13427 RepID=A0ACB8ZYT3_CICIN|nr:hypothetical protein L2E82_45959 [Cichorium intybus]
MKVLEKQQLIEFAESLHSKLNYFDELESLVVFNIPYVVSSLVVTLHKLVEISSQTLVLNMKETVMDAVEFVLQNFSEMNKLWVTMEHQGLEHSQSQRMFRGLSPGCLLRDSCHHGFSLRLLHLPLSLDFLEEATQINAHRYTRHARKGVYFMLNGSPYFVHGFNAYWLLILPFDPSQISKVAAKLGCHRKLGKQFERSQGSECDGYVLHVHENTKRGANEVIRRNCADHSRMQFASQVPSWWQKGCYSQSPENSKRQETNNLINLYVRSFLLSYLAFEVLSIVLIPNLALRSLIQFRVFMVVCVFLVYQVLNPEHEDDIPLYKALLADTFKTLHRLHLFIRHHHEYAPSSDLL